MSALPRPTLRPIITTAVPPPHNAGDAQHQQAEGTAPEHDYCCRTPTSPESQLPSSGLANVICPPAPRKPRRAVLMRPRKRRLLQVDLESEECYSDLESPAPEVITVSTEELEAAFRKPDAHHDSYCTSETNGGSYYCRKRKR